MIMLLSHLHNYSSMVLIIEIYIIGLCYIINFMIPYLKQLILLLLKTTPFSTQTVFCNDVICLLSFVFIVWLIVGSFVVFCVQRIELVFTRANALCKSNYF